MYVYVYVCMCVCVRVCVRVCVYRERLFSRLKPRGLFVGTRTSSWPHGWPMAGWDGRINYFFSSFSPLARSVFPFEIVEAHAGATTPYSTLRTRPLRRNLGWHLSKIILKMMDATSKETYLNGKSAVAKGGDAFETHLNGREKRKCRRRCRRLVVRNARGIMPP